MKQSLLSTSGAALAAVLAVSLTVGGPRPARDTGRHYDWPRWGGPEGNRVPLESSWKPEARNGKAPSAWVAQVGAGFSNMAIHGDRLYMMRDGAPTQWGVWSRKLIEGDRLLITSNSYGIAINKATGEAYWQSPADEANSTCSLIDAYATSVVFTREDTRLFLQFDDYGLSPDAV